MENFGSQDIFDDTDSESELDRKFSRGVPLVELKRNVDPIPISDRRTSLICVNVENFSRPYPKNRVDKWDENFVRMPCSDQSLYPKKTEKKNRKKLVQRWNLIEQALSRAMKSFDDLESAILEYNMRDRWQFDGLKLFLNSLNEEEELPRFFSDLLPRMAELGLKLPEKLTSPLPLLKRRQNRSITLSQEQISCLLANAFFCTFPRRNAHGKHKEYSNYPYINFNRLYESDHSEKLRCLFHYFRRRMSGKCGNNLVTFHRRCLPLDQIPNWSRSKKTLTKLRVSPTGTIEDDGIGMLQVDFANKYVGGGVLGNGCVQEEIRFLICPELIVSRLFSEKLDDNEVLIVSGFERYSKYKGYASTFNFDGDYQQSSEATIDDFGNVQQPTSYLVAMDALQFPSYVCQYSEQNVRRELDKAYVGFYNSENSRNPATVATGNWGCGAFGGDSRLKALIQLMAAAENDRDVLYFTFGDQNLADQLYEIYVFLTETQKITVGKLYQLIVSYWDHMKGEERPTKSVFEFIYEIASYEVETSDEEPKKDGNYLTAVEESDCVIDMETEDENSSKAEDMTEKTPTTFNGARPKTQKKVSDYFSAK